MLLIDSMMLVHRCAAKMDFLKNEAGEPTGMEFGFLRSLQMLQHKYPDQSIVTCWEAGGTAKRRKTDGRYKAGRRPMDASLRERVRVLRQFCRSFYFDAEAPGYEADDAMYSLAATREGPHCVYTNDDDLLQAVDDARGVKVLKSFSSKLFEWDEAEVREKYGVLPRDLPLYRAFTGDGSDALPGVPRIDKRYLVALVNWYREMRGLNHEYDDAVWAICEIRNAEWHWRMIGAVQQHVDSGQALRNYELMRLQAVHVDCREPELDRERVVAQLQRWQIRTLDLCAQFRGELASAKDEEF